MAAVEAHADEGRGIRRSPSCHRLLAPSQLVPPLPLIHPDCKGSLLPPQPLNLPMIQPAYPAHALATRPFHVHLSVIYEPMPIIQRHRSLIIFTPSDGLKMWSSVPTRGRRRRRE